MKSKRLFLFASYDRDAIIDDYVIYYLAELSKLGDIIFVTDNDNSDAEIARVKPYTIHQIIGKHGEYDFGSYKRAYVWARDNDLLSKYDWVYLVNDSAYGPTSDLKPIVEKLENSGSDAVGLFYHDYLDEAYLQSWFIGLKPKIFKSRWFDHFISDVKKEKTKELVVEMYEMKFTKLLKEKKHTISFITKHKKNQTFIDPIWALNSGIPFIKKASFYNIEGEFLDNVQWGNDDLERAVKKNITRVMDQDVLKNMRNRRFRFVFFDLINKSFLSIRGRYKKNGNYRFLIRLFHLPIFYMSVPKKWAIKEDK